MAKAAKTWINNEEWYVQGNDAGNTGDADWDKSLVRYFFIDGDNGNDSHAGFLDAAPGHVFSPTDAAAVAIKTTKRLDGIRPANGNGRMAVTLWKPRAGRAVYDYATPGDGKGVNDRSRLSGYALLHDRGSDHTNSATDKHVLGYLAAPGHGPWAVSAVNSRDAGPEIVLTGATFESVVGNILPYRVKVTKASGAILTLPPRWGDTTTGARTNVITIKPNTLTPDVVDVGDSVVLDQPGVLVYGYLESQVPAQVISASGVVPSRPSLLAAGLAVSDGVAYLGSNEASQPPEYVGFATGVGTGTTRILGSLVSGPFYLDESSSLAGRSNFGWLAFDTIVWGNSGPEILPESLAPNYGVFLGQCDFMALANDSAFVTAINMVLQGLPNRAVLNAWDYGTFNLKCCTSVDLSHCRAIPGGVVEIDSRSFSDLKRRRESSVSFSDCIDLVPSSNDRNPGVAIMSGAPLVTFEFNDGPESRNPDVKLGSGMSLQLNATTLAGADFEIPNITWGSLRITGFEVADGGPKVVCRVRPTGGDVTWPDQIRPCPRCFPQKFVDIEGTYPEYPVGTVVQSNGNGEGIFLATLGTAIPGNLHWLGVLTTNATSPGNDGPTGIGAKCLVCVNDACAVQVHYPAGGYPIAGDPVYIGYDTAAGMIEQNPQQRDGNNLWGPVRLGTAMSWGYKPSTIIVVALNPSTMPYQHAPSGGFSKTNDTLAAVANASAVLKSGHIYRVRAVAEVDGGAAGGYKFALTSPDLMTMDHGFFAHKLFAVTPAPSFVSAAVNSTFGPTGAVALGIGTTKGIWEIDGFIAVADGGTLNLSFAQATTDATPNTVTFVTFEAIEQQ